MAQVVAGVTGFTWQGKDYVVGSTAKYSLGGLEATSLTGLAARVGSEYKFAVAFIEVEIHFPEGEGPSDIEIARNDGTAVLTCMDRTVTLSFAERVGAPPENDATKNSATVRFEGGTAKEVSL